MRSPLPIDPLLPEITGCLRRDGLLVLEADPGAGKTTRVPLALLEDEGSNAGTIVVTEPRRLAARLAAQHVAREIGQDVGKTVGYSVRFEQAAGRDTRVLYATEGVMLRRLLADPTLSGVSTIVLDEFHERHVALDLLLALVLRLRRTSRPDLRLLVMSATLEGERVAAHLGGCRHLRSEGRLHPVRMDHLEKEDDRPLERQVASAVRRAVLAGKGGDILVFLPGASDIRRTSEKLESLSREADLLVVPLHGDLSMAEQTRAVEPADRRKVILATNVAESSVTVAGVTVVVDSGLVKRASHSPWSGLPRLQVSKISKASAVQRAGRAGRLGPGSVYRLYTRSDYATRPEHEAPEITRTDLAEPMLLLGALGIPDASSLDWLTPPPEAVLASGRNLLVALGAVGDNGELSQVGRRMLTFPVAPRLARLIVEGERLGVGREAVRIAALLSERDIRRTARARFGDHTTRASTPTGPSDVLLLLALYREAEDARFSRHTLRTMDLDAQAVLAVSRTAERLAKLARDTAPQPSSAEAVETAVLRAILSAYPDRVARRRAPASRSIVLSGGETAELSEDSVVRAEPLMVALDVEEQRGRHRGNVVRLASSIAADWLLEAYPERVETAEELVWNAERQRVDLVSKMTFGSVVLDEERTRAPPSSEATELLQKHALLQNRHRSDEMAALVRRIDLLREHSPEVAPSVTGAEAAANALRESVGGATSLEEVFPESTLLAILTAEERAALEREAPERIQLASGRSLPVHYEPNIDPWVASRLQDFFGTTEVPSICKGRIALTVHLLAPNGRAVQVTRDLSGFWQRHYPALRPQLSRRYPKHSWPEDGGTAAPPPPRPPRRGSPPKGKRRSS